MSPEKYKRFENAEIILHWANAVPFIVLLLSGAVMLSSRFWNMEASLFKVLVYIHKGSGIVWVALLFLSLLGGIKIHLKNLGLMLLWGAGDFKWLFSAVKAVFNPHVEVHPAGKFNTGQKINSILFFFYTLVFPLSGFIMWFFGTILLAWYFHAAIFFMAFASVGGHLYLSFINPSTRVGLGGIFHGPCLITKEREKPELTILNVG
jgi:formate dehydrogenase subunit gamma